MTAPHPSLELARHLAGPHPFTWLSTWAGTDGVWVASVQQEGKGCAVATAAEPLAALVEAILLSIEMQPHAGEEVALARRPADDKESLDYDGY